jgi:hypothetical protein
MTRSEKREKRKQVAVALSQEQRWLLERASQRSGRSVAQEIRERLDRAIELDAKDAAIDPVTKELCDALQRIADRLFQDFGSPWHTSLRAHQAFAAAVSQRIAGYIPLDGARSAAASESSAVVGLDEPPETIGRLRETDDRREYAVLYPQLQAAQAARSSQLRSLNTWAPAVPFMTASTKRSTKERNE